MIWNCANGHRSIRVRKENEHVGFKLSLWRKGLLRESWGTIGYSLAANKLEWFELGRRIQMTKSIGHALRQMNVLCDDGGPYDARTVKEESPY